MTLIYLILILLFISLCWFYLGNNSAKIIKTKSTKITEETIELTDPKAVAEALGLNDKKKKEEEPEEIEEEIDIEAIETGKKK